MNVMIVIYSLRFKMSVTLAKKNCFKMNVTFSFQYNNNFFFSIVPSNWYFAHYF